MKYILILWLVSGYGRGIVHSIEFFNKTSCEEALQEIHERTDYVQGICVRK